MSVSSIGLSVLPLHHWLPWCVDSGDASTLDIPLFPSATHRHIRAGEPKLARLSPHHYQSLPVTTGHYRSLPVTTPRPTLPASQLGRVPLGHAPCPYPSDNRGNRPAPSASTAAFLLPCPNGPTVAVTTCRNMSQHTGVELLMPAWDWKSAASSRKLIKDSCPKNRSVELPVTFGGAAPCRTGAMYYYVPLYTADQLAISSTSKPQEMATRNRNITSIMAIELRHDNE